MPRLRSRILRVAAELPKGDKTRHEILAVLKYGRISAPPSDVVNLFQNLITEGSLKARGKAKDVAMEFASEVQGYVWEKGTDLMAYDTCDGKVTQEDVVEHSEFGNLDYVVENAPQYIYYGGESKDTWPTVVKGILERMNVRGNIKQIALRLSGSGSWLKYLRSNQRAIEMGVAEDIKEEFDFDAAEEQAQECVFEKATFRITDDAYEDVDIDWRVVLENDDPSVEIIIDRKGIDWGVSMDSEITVKVTGAVFGTFTPRW